MRFFYANVLVITLLHVCLPMQLTSTVEESTNLTLQKKQKNECGELSQKGYRFHDGRDELLTMHEIMRFFDETKGKKVSEWEDMFPKIDADKDGKLSYGELEAHYGDEQAKFFISRLDSANNHVGAKRKATCAVVGYREMSNTAIAPAVCKDDGTWTKATGCVAIHYNHQSGEKDCGPPTFLGYLYGPNKDNMLELDEWIDIEPDVFHIADANHNGFVTVTELEGLLDAHQDEDPAEIINKYDTDRNTFGSKKTGVCNVGYTGDASEITCGGDGQWSLATGCTVQTNTQKSLLMMSNEVFSTSIDMTSNEVNNTMGRTFSTRGLQQACKWIAEEYSKQNTDFCYRPYYDRGPGTPVHCGGLVQFGMQCYNHCSKGNGVGSQCCYWKPLRCWWDWGPKCSGGYLSCWFRGGGHWASSCSSDRTNQNALCYKKPRSGYLCEATMCSKKCPSYLVYCGPTGPAAGCSGNSAKCANQIVSMVMGPIMLLANIATMGRSSMFTGRMKVAIQTFEKSAKAVKRAKMAYDRTDNGLNMATLAKTMTDAAMEFVNIFKDELESILPKHIVNNVLYWCPKGSHCYKQLGKTWAAKLAYSTSKAANAALEMQQLEMMDPTGVLGVVNAYNKQQCQDLQPYMPGGVF